MTIDSRETFSYVQPDTSADDGLCDEKQRSTERTE